MKPQSNTTAVPSIPQYSLKDAVLETVKTTLIAKGNFSIYDVTEAIREAANEGEFALPGLEATQPSSFKYNVAHDSVKEVVNFLVADGTFANLGMTKVNYDGSYRVFEFTTPTVNPTVQSGAATTVSTDNSDVDIDGPVAKRIKTYVSKVGTATIRQIHSTLKIPGLSSEDLLNIVKELGYKVAVGTEGKFSTYTVE